MLKNSDSEKQEKDNQLLCQMMSLFDDEPKSNFRTRKTNSGVVMPLFNRYIEYSKLVCNKQFKKDGPIQKNLKLAEFSSSISLFWKGEQ